MGSRRLPGKVLKKIVGFTVLEHIVSRLKISNLLDDVVVATSGNVKDRVIAELAADKNWHCFLGSESDVLGRFFHAAQKFEAETIVRVCADCIFYDPQLLDEVLIHYETSHCDYATTTVRRTFPRGIAIEVFSMQVLQYMHENATEERHREHITGYIQDHPNGFSICHYTDDSGRYDPNWRWVVDTKKDFDFARAVYSDLFKDNGCFGAEEIRQWVLVHPEKCIYHAK